MPKKAREGGKIQGSVGGAEGEGRGERWKE